MVGLTGSAADIERVKQQYGVYSEKAPLPGGGYSVNHTASVFLMGRDGKYLGFFPPGTPAARMEQAIRPHLKAVIPKDVIPGSTRDPSPARQ